MATLGTLSVGLSGVNQIDSLLNGRKWQSTNLTFSFMTSGSSWSGYVTGSEPYSGFRSLTSTQQNAAQKVLTAWASVCNLTFTEVTEPESLGVIRLGYSSLPTTSWAYLPQSDETAGDVWFGTGTSGADNPVVGNYDYTVYLHEIGHALGLDHPHEDFPVADSTIDSINYSVMSYRSYTGDDLEGYSNASDSYAQTPMMSDIAAVQYLYGANYNYNSDNTIYKFTPASGKIFETIWDGGGNDTYDLEAYINGVQVDLNPGAWSTFSKSQLAWLNEYDDGNSIYAYGNVANALLYYGDTRSLIENAIGGSGNDVLKEIKPITY